MVGSYPTIPSNFGMYAGSLVGIEGQPTSWCMGSFINWLRSGRLNPTIKGSMRAARTVPETVLPDVITGVELEPPLGWVHAPALGLDMVTICNEGGSKSDEESEG